MASVRLRVYMDYVTDVGLARIIPPPGAAHCGARILFRARLRIRPGAAHTPQDDNRLSPAHDVLLLPLVYDDRIQISGGDAVAVYPRFL